MSFLDWEDKYKVYVDVIDEQHEKLFDIVNLMYEALIHGEEQNSISDILESLISYTVYHFETEENMFKEYGYPKLEEHKALHNELTNQVYELQEQFNLNVVTITFDVMDFLSEWIKVHTTGADLEFAKFMKSKQ